MNISLARRLVAVATVSAMGLLVGCGARVSDDPSTGAAGAGCVDTSGSSVKIGFLNSRSGTMAISENTVYNSLKLAADQFNAAGGVGQ